MWYQRSHIFEPLTRISSDKTKFNWTEAQHKSYSAMKKMMAKKIIFCCLNFGQDFDVYTGGGDYQLGVVIVQKDGPVDFYRRKLTSSQRNYTVMGKELLSTIETCVYFCNFLKGFKIDFFRSQEPDLRQFKI